MPKSERPTVSVIMPVYNAEEHLVEALDSILGQSFRDFEVICVDDNSKDSSYEILKRYKKEFPNYVRVYKNDRNMGVGYSSNLALEKAKGVLVARMDSDDFSYKDRLENQAKFLLNNPEVVMVGGQIVIADFDGNVIGEKKFPRDHKHLYEMMFYVVPIQQGASMVNRALLPKDFKFYMGNSRTAEEVELFFKLLEFGNLANIESKVLKYRQYQHSTSLKNPKKTFYTSFNTRVKAIKKYNYKPTLKAWFIALSQFVIVSILPKSWVYPVFSFLRGIKAGQKFFSFLDFRVLLQTKIEFPFKSDD